MGPEDGIVGEEFDRMGRRTTDIWVIVGQSEQHRAVGTTVPRVH